jgi:hypothetical protein
VGELGETELRRLAAQGDLVLNPARRDRTGFDGLLELNAPASAASPDLVSAAFRAFVQVKATRRARNGARRNRARVSIKLSNWQRMVSDPAPWFIFVVHLDQDDVAYEAFLLHVDEDRVGQAVKALRHVDGDLHKKRLSTPYGDEHRLNVLHGSELRRSLLDAIGNDAFVYQQRKHAHYKNCGYDGHAWRATFEFDAERDELFRKWEGIALGSHIELPFKKVVVENVRFGRAVLCTDLPSGEGVLTVTPKATPGTLHVESADRFEWISLPAAIYSTANMPRAEPERVKIRIAAGPLSTTISMPRSGHASDEPWRSESTDFDETSPCRVGALASAARALLLLTKKGATVSLSFQSEPARRLKLLTLTSETHDAARVADLEEWIAAGQVAARFGLEDLVVDPQLILDRAPGLAFLQSVLTNTLRGVEFSIDVADPQASGEMAVIMCPAAVLGDKVLVTCAAMFGVPTVTGTGLVFKPQRVHVEDVSVVPQADLAELPLGDKVATLGAALLGQMGPGRVIPPRESNGLMFLGRPVAPAPAEAS